MTSLRADLYQLDFADGLKSQKTLLSGIGRIRDVVQGPDGSLYVITSNTDGKGFPDNMDDKLMRILKWVIHQFQNFLKKLEKSD